MDALREISASKEDGAGPDLRKLADLDIATFSDALIEAPDVACITQVLSSCPNDSKAHILEIIAELAKSEKNRDVLTNEDMFEHILNEVDGEDKNVTLQCFRAIGNICIDNEKGQRCVMMSGKIDKILENFKSLTETSGNGLGNFPRTAYGCVMNLACENESLQLELVKHGAIPIFFNNLKALVQEGDDLAEVVLEALSGLTVNEAAKEQMIELNVIIESISMLKRCSENVAISIIESLTEFIEDDELGAVICSRDCLLEMISAGTVRPSFNKKSSPDEVLKKLFDVIVLFTSNELFNPSVDDQCLLNKFIELLKCENKHVQTSAALAIGNYARNDMICTELVKNGCHSALIHLLKATYRNEDAQDQVQAVLSALKNISIPVSNKPVLSQTELPDISMEIVKTAGAAVQFKALAVLRLLVQEQTSLAVHLCNDEQFLQAIADCSKREKILGLCAEGRRLTAALVKNCHSSDSMKSLLRSDAIRSLLGLLSSDHSIMQNEALVAIVTLLTCGKDASTELVNAGGIEESVKLLKNASKKPHLVFNLISLFTAICQDENGKGLLKDQIMSEIEQLANGPNELVQNRSLELLMLLKG